MVTIPLLEPIHTRSPELAKAASFRRLYGSQQTRRNTPSVPRLAGAAGRVVPASSGTKESGGVDVPCRRVKYMSVLCEDVFVDDR
jgi:hypothetical protein